MRHPLSRRLRRARPGPERPGPTGRRPPGASARAPLAPPAPVALAEPHPSDGPRRFVVQHRADGRTAYVLALEWDGRLLRWRLPEGPSVRPGVARAAHRLADGRPEDAEQEGRAGNGTGVAIVWDAGWYRLRGAGEVRTQLARGRLALELTGAKLRGGWTLRRVAGAAWRLVKAPDAHAGGEEPTAHWPESVRSGVRLADLRAVAARLPALRARLRALGAPAGRPDLREPPMLATLVDRLPAGPGWLFELKWDGVRVLALRDGPRVTLAGRHGQDVTARYPEVVAALQALPVERVLLDGELVALDEAGRPSFQRLQARLGLTRPADIERARARVPVTAVLFDLLALDGRDLRGLPLRARKACLAALVPPGGPLRYGDHVEGDGRALFERVCAAGLEGVVAKRADSAYAPGRSRDWLKVKCQQRQAFVVGGWTEPQGARGCFGALHLGRWEDGRLVYVSRVGAGFDAATLRAVWERLRPLERATSPFAAGTPTGRGHHWVEPALVAEVRFSGWTDDGGLRHPVFLGLREDKRPEECVRAAPGTPDGPAPPPGAAGPRARGRRADPDDAAPPTVTVTNPDKVFWPDAGYTKGDLVRYYERVAPWLLPYLEDRPVVLTRYPDGIAGKSFFQKDAPRFTPAWIRRVPIASDEGGRVIEYLVIDGPEALRWVANLGTIPLHLWASRVGSLDRPDWLVLDLDPKGAPFAHVVRVARTLRRLLDELGVPSYVKTSGQSGLHVLVPLGARYSYAQARTFARLLATLGAEAEPEIATVARPLRARGGRVYIDWGQNGPGQTIVAPFAVRPLPGAPVSCPLDWAEVTPALDPRRFTIATVPARFARRPDPMAPVLREQIDLAGVLARLERR